MRDRLEIADKARKGENISDVTQDDVVITVDTTVVQGSALESYRPRLVIPAELEGHLALSSVGNPPPVSPTYRATNPEPFSASVITPYAPPSGTYEATSIIQMYEMAPLLDESYAFLYRVGVLNGQNSVGNATPMSFTIQNNTISHMLELTLTVPKYFTVSSSVYPITIAPEQSTTFSLVPSEVGFKEYIPGVFDEKISFSVRPLNVTSPVYVKFNAPAVTNPDTLAAPPSSTSNISADETISQAVDEVVDDLLDTSEGFENAELIADTINAALEEAQGFLSDPAYTTELFMSSSTVLPPTTDTGTPAASPARSVVLTAPNSPNSIGAIRRSKKLQALTLLARLRGAS